MNLISQERIDIVPVFFDSGNQHLLIFFPILLKFIGEDVESLIVGIFLDGGSSLKTIDNQFQGDLSIHIANRQILLEKRSERFLPIPHPLRIQMFHQLVNLLLR